MRRWTAGPLVGPAEAPQAAAEVAHAVAARGAAAAPELALLRFQPFMLFVSHFRSLIIFTFAEVSADWDFLEFLTL